MKTIKRILVATDFTPPSERAVQLATELATTFNASLTLVHVFEYPPALYTDAPLSSADLVEPALEEVKFKLSETLGSICRQIPEASAKIRQGIPHEEISAAARESAADLIVIGTHGRTGLARGVLGSVAETVVRLSPVPVLTVRQPEARTPVIAKIATGTKEAAAIQEMAETGTSRVGPQKPDGDQWLPEARALDTVWPVSETLFDELKRYVRFDADDQDTLRTLHPLVSPEFARIADVFYRRILEHPEARKALAGESQVGRLKLTLVVWMDKLFTGPWDEEYYKLRARIGRVHVRIALPQHYMFGAMNVLRHEMNGVIDLRFLHRPDELRRARVAVDKMLDLELAIMLHTYREDLLSQQARTERLATFGQLVGSIGHELRNPLSVIESSVFILKGRIGEDERAAKHVDRISEQLAIANDIISKLLDMIRDRPLSRETIRVDEVIGVAASSIQWPPGVRLVQNGIAHLPPVAADPGQLRQVFVNLLSNAVHASSPQGEVMVSGRRDGEVLELSVEDTGPGVDDAVRGRLFEPLVTSKSSGIGLGLALVKRIMERHGGTIRYQPGPRGGAHFSVRLPISGG